MESPLPGITTRNYALSTKFRPSNLVSSKRNRMVLSCPIPEVDTPGPEAAHADGQLSRGLGLPARRLRWTHTMVNGVPDILTETPATSAHAPTSVPAAPE
jgi:hypothetical protein